jgi:hypothetical protein
MSDFDIYRQKGIYLAKDVSTTRGIFYIRVKYPTFDDIVVLSQDLN